MLRPRTMGILGELLGQFNRDDSFAPSVAIPKRSQVPYNVDTAGSSARTFGKALDQFNMSQAPTPLAPRSLASQREPFRPPVNLGDTSTMPRGMPTPPQVMTVDQRPDLNQEARSQMREPNRMTSPRGPVGSGVMRPGADVMGMEKLAEQAAKAVEIERKSPETAAQPRFQNTVKEFFGDRENMLQLALAFNSMRMRPDTGLASVIGSELEGIQAKKLITGSANKTVQSLRSIGTPEAITAANMIEANPTMAKTIFSEYVEKSMKGDEDLFKNEGDLRKEYTGQPAVKEFAKQSAAFGRVVTSAKDASAAGDLALIFNFMKVLDPGSVVREGEFATAQNAAGVPGRIKSLYNSVIDGQRLNEEQRNDFVNRARMLYEQSASEYQSIRENYTDIAGQYGYDTERTIPDLFAQNEQLVRPSISYDQLPADTKARFATAEEWNAWFQSQPYLKQIELLEAL